MNIDLNTAAQAVCNGDETTSSTQAGGLGIGLGEYSHQTSAFSFGNDSNIYGTGTGEFGSHLPDFPHSSLYTF